jgi:hypothetical protein
MSPLLRGRPTLFLAALMLSLPSPAGGAEANQATLKVTRTKNTFTARFIPFHVFVNGTRIGSVENGVRAPSPSSPRRTVRTSCSSASART